MSRGLTADMLAALTANTVRPVFLYEGTFLSGTVNLWTGLGNLQWDDKTWQGVGDLLSIGTMEETDDVKAGGITITLSGIGDSNIALALGEMRRNLPGVVKLALLTPTGEVVPDPKTIFRGRLDVCTIDDAPDTTSVSVTYENELIDLQRPRELRYTDEEQKRLFPGDKGLEYVSGMVDKTIRWGSTT